MITVSPLPTSGKKKEKEISGINGARFRRIHVQ